MAYEKPGDLSYARVRPEYVGAPVAEIQALQQAADTKYKENQANADLLDIAVQNAELHSKDEPARQEALARLKGTLKDVTDNGNWETAHLLVQKAGKEYANDQRLQAAMKVPAQRAALAKELDDRLNSKEKDLRISKDAHDRALRMNEAMYEGVKLNPVTGRWEANYPNFTPSAYVDAVEVASEAAKGWAADKLGREVAYAGLDDSGNWVMKGKDGRVIEGVNQEEVANHVANYLQSHQGLKDYHSSLDVLDNFDRKQKGLRIDPTTGQPIDYSGKKEYDMFREQMMQQAQNSGSPAPSEEQIVNAFENQSRFKNDILRGAGFAAAKYGYKSDVSTQDRDMNANQFALDNAKSNPNIGSIISNPSQAENITGVDFSARVQNVFDLEQKVKQAEDNLSKLEKGKANEIDINTAKKNLESLRLEHSSASQSVDYIKSQMRKAGYDLTDDELSDVIYPKAFGTHNQTQGNRMLDDLNSIPESARTPELKRLIDYYNKAKAEEGDFLSTGTSDLTNHGKTIIKELSRTKAGKEMIDKLKSKAISQITANSSDMFKSAPARKVLKYFDDNVVKGLQSASNVIKSTNSNDIISNTEKQYKELLPASESFITPSNVTIRDFFANTEFADDAKPSLSKSDVSLTDTPGTDGKFYLQVNIKDAEGKDLRYKDNDQSAVKLMAPKNQEDYKKSIYSIGEQLYRKGDTQKGLQYMANASFPEVYTVVPEAMTAGEPKFTTITFPNGGKYDLAFKKGQGNSLEVYFAEPDGKGYKIGAPYNIHNGTNIVPSTSTLAVDLMSTFIKTTNPQIQK